MKNMVYLLGLAVVGLAAYYLINKKGNNESVIEDPWINPNLQTQPSEKFPLQIPISPRVDDADQPWYNGSREILSSATQAINALDINSENIMSYKTNEFWSQLESAYLH